MAAIHVLCVDDDPDVLAVLSMLLRRTPDLECVGALSTVVDVAAEADARGADIVVIDFGIPGVDSVEQLHKLMESGSPAKAIVFSGNNDDHSVTLALEAGAAAYVAKATDPRILLDTIRKVARDAQSEDHPGEVRFLRRASLVGDGVPHHHVR